MKQVLFLDFSNPEPYSFYSLSQKGSGASESYLLYTANALVQYLNCKVFVIQQRLDTIFYNNLSILPYGELENPNYHNPKDIDVVVVQRNPNLISFVKKTYPNAKIILWLHDFYESTPFPELTNKYILEEVLLDNVLIVCQSEWAKKNMSYKFEQRGLPVDNITYNYFYVHADPYEFKKITYSKTKYNKNQLCFFSAKHKGLEQAINVFKLIKSHWSDMVLVVGNPAYVELDLSSVKNDVEYVGEIPRSKVLEYLNQSLTCLHLNMNYPETFGCVNAEANMVHTPVITYKVGATSEVLTDVDQFININPFEFENTGIQDVLNKIQRWRNGERPKVELNQLFTIKKWKERWKKIL